MWIHIWTWRKWFWCSWVDSRSPSVHNVFSLSAFQSLLNNMFYLVWLLTGAQLYPTLAAEAQHLKSHLLFICNEQNGFQTRTASSPGVEEQLSPRSLWATDRPSLSSTSMVQAQEGMDDSGQVAKKQWFMQRFWVWMPIPSHPGCVTSGTFLALSEPHFFIRGRDDEVFANHWFP